MFWCDFPRIFSALLDAPTNFVRQCLPHLSEFQKTVMNFWQRVVVHSNIFRGNDWNYFFDLTSLSTILIAQTLGQIITTSEKDLKFIHEVPREERDFLQAKLFEKGLEEPGPENGSLSKIIIIINWDKTVFLDKLSKYFIPDYLSTLQYTVFTMILSFYPNLKINLP